MPYKKSGSGYGTGKQCICTGWYGPCDTYRHVLRNGTIKNDTDTTVMGWHVILRHTEWHAFGGTHMHVVRDGTSNYTEWHVLKMTRAGSFHGVL